MLSVFQRVLYWDCQLVFWQCCQQCGHRWVRIKAVFGDEPSTGQQPVVPVIVAAIVVMVDIAVVNTVRLFGRIVLSD